MLSTNFTRSQLQIGQTQFSGKLLLGHPWPCPVAPLRHEEMVRQGSHCCWTGAGTLTFWFQSWAPPPLSSAPSEHPTRQLGKTNVVCEKTSFHHSKSKNRSPWGISACCTNSTKSYPSMMLCPPNSQSQVYRTGILHTALSWSWRMTSPSDGPQLCFYFFQSQPTWLTSMTPLAFAAISPSDLWKLNNPQGQFKSLLC